ncbi:MAG TPA: hypothetical protein VJ862_04225 [Rhodanobacteraceae bacterium]|nr:hypothetical protein [Rhodanobacteraceae bacterium]
MTMRSVSSVRRSCTVRQVRNSGDIAHFDDALTSERVQEFDAIAEMRAGVAGRSDGSLKLL